MRSPVTKAIVAINVLVYAYLWYYLPMTQGEPAVQEFLDNFGLLPSEFRAGAFWQPVTCLFIHDGVALAPMHILFNMLGVWSLGHSIESTVGSLRFSLLSFFSGVSGSLFVILFQPGLDVHTIGASGLLLGLLGALAVFYPNSRMLVFFIPMKARTAAIIIGILSIALPLMGKLEMISHMGHLGGLIGGVLYARFVLGLKFGENVLTAQEMGPIGTRVFNNSNVRDLFNRVQRPNPDRWRPDREEPPIDIVDEKVINPMPGESPRPRRLYYDPVTGKHFTR